MFWGLALAPCQYCNVRYPTGFKPAITFCRSNQIASNSVCRWRGPISIYLFCWLIFMQSVTEIQLNKLCAHFRARFAPMIWANCAPLNVWGGGDYYIGANQAGKRACSLFNCISVTDGIKINEQNKSIGIGPLYLYTEFEAISLLLQKVMAGLNPVGYRTLQYWQGASARSQKVFYQREMVWYEVLKIGC